MVHIRQITKYLNYTSCATAAWLWLYPHPYNLAIAVAITLPLIGLFLVFRSKGTIRIISTENSKHPSISVTLTVPPSVVMIRVLLDYNILAYQNAWIYAVAITPVILLIILLGTQGKLQENKSKSEQIMMYPILTAIIGSFVFFSCISINCSFDDSKPELYEATVLEKKVKIYDESPTRYQVTIGPWRDLKSQTEVNVSESQYEKVKVGRKVNVCLNSGLLDIPWIYITTNFKSE